MSVTPNAFDMERIHDFLRPQVEGGVGGGTAGWIGYCLGITHQRAHAACEALVAQGRLMRWFGEYRHPWGKA